MDEYNKELCQLLIGCAVFIAVMLGAIAVLYNIFPEEIKHTYYEGTVTDVKIDAHGLGSVLNPLRYETHVYLDNGQVVILHYNESNNFLIGEHYNITVEGEGPMYYLADAV